MTVLFSKKCEYGVQAVLYLAAKSGTGTIPAKEIAKKLNIPKEFIAKILQNLTESGIIASKKGKAGGFYLIKNPKKVTLIDIVAAIDGLEIFNTCILGFPECNPYNPCPLHDKWGQLRKVAYQILTDETIDTFRDRTLKKLDRII